MPDSTIDSLILTTAVTNCPETVELQESDNGMESFFNQVAETCNVILDLESETNKFKSLKNKYFMGSAADCEEPRGVNGLISTITTRARKVEEILKDMEKKYLNRMCTNSVSSSLRIQKAQHAALLDHYTDVMNQYEKILQYYDKHCIACAKKVA